MTTGPYRESDALLLCPACGDVLLAVFDAVRACPRCIGVWVPQTVIDRAFADPHWPRGPGVWWRRSRECPECAATGTPSTMNAISTGTIVVDRCAGHGAYFDAGELRHLLDSPEASDVAALHAKVAPGTPPPDESWRTSVDAKQREAQLASYRARQALVAEQRDAERAETERREKAAAAAAAEAERAARALENAERVRRKNEALERAAAARAAKAAQREEYLAAVATVDQLEAELVRKRAELRGVEDALTRARWRVSELLLRGGDL